MPLKCSWKCQRKDGNQDKSYFKTFVLSHFIAINNRDIGEGEGERGEVLFRLLSIWTVREIFRRTPLKL